MTKLVTLRCHGNPIEVLDLSNCSALRVLNIQNETDNAIVENELKLTYYDQSESLTIDVSNTIMNRIYVCRSEKLAYLDISKNTHLTQLSAYVNPNLKSIDVSKLAQLEILDLGDCDLTNLDVSQNILLTKLYVTNNKLSTLDVSQNKQLTVLKCKNNQISNLKVVNNNILETLDASGNQLSTINVRNNTALKDLRVSNNININLLYLNNNTALETLYADGLSISEIDLVNNIALKYIDFSNNNLLKCAYTADSFTIENTVISIDSGMKILDAAGNYNLNPVIGAYIIVNGSEGVVFTAINAYGESKIVSLSEASLRWSTETVSTGALDENDGAVNMNTIRSLNPDLSKYPAFKWCADYGIDWYLPAYKELKVIYSNKSKLNEGLSKVGGTLLGNDYGYNYANNFYWSSTEKEYKYGNAGNAYRYDFDENTIIPIDKTATQKVRAVYVL